MNKAQFLTLNVPFLPIRQKYTQIIIITGINIYAHLGLIFSGNYVQDRFEGDKTRDQETN